MGEVVYLFQKMTAEEAKIIIISNLKESHHGKFVNWHCAVKGIKDWDIAGPALRALVAEGIVEQEDFTVENMLGREYVAPLYRYNSLRDLQ